MNSLQELQNLRLANDIRVDALQDGPSPWNFLVPNRNVLYYTFDASAGSVMDVETATSLAAFNSTQKDAARSILAYVSQLVGITFTEVDTSAQADFHFAATDLEGSSNVSGLNSTYYRYSFSGDQIVSLTAESLVWLDNVQFGVENNNPQANTQGYETLLHEIGHALGLGHPFEATSQSPANLPPADDNTNNTVMSYTQAGGWKTTFQSYDVLALTWIYGADGLGGTWGYNSTQGNTLNPSSADTTPPVALTFNPTDGSTGLDPAGHHHVVVTFSEPVQRGTGSIVLRTAAGQVVATYDAATSSSLAISGSTLTLTMGAILAPGTTYFVNFPAGSLKDLSGNPYAGTSTYDFTTLAVNRAPVAANGAATVAEDTFFKGQLPVATDADGDAVTFAAQTSPSNGQLQVNANGSFTYTPTANFSGSDAFAFRVSDSSGASNTYTMAMTVTPVNDAPVANSAGTVTAMGVPVSGRLVATDIEGDPLTYYLSAVPSHGMVQITSDGRYTYVPTANYRGPDSFSFVANDGAADSGSGLISITVDAADTAAPTLVSASPADGATGVALDANLVLTFNEAMQRGTGNLVLKTMGGTVVETFNIATNTANLTLSGKLLTVNPTANLTANTGHVLEFATGVLKDLSGNPLAGASLDFTAQATAGVSGGVTGTDRNDSLQGTASSDVLVPGLGIDVVNGGAGTDTAVLKMFPSFHTFTQTAPGSVTSNYGGNTVTLNSVEQVRFGAQFQTTLPVTSLLSGEVQTQVERLTDLYLAFFGRAPDVGGLEYWQEQLLEGHKTQNAITIDFAFSDEAKALFPATGSNREFVRTVYLNSFGREPDAGGWDYWTERLDSLGTTDLSERGTFVAEVLLGAYAPTSGAEDRTKLSYKHDVALHYVNQLSLPNQEAFDDEGINNLLALVTLDPATKAQAIAVIDYALNNPITLGGVMDDVALFNSIWGG